jgi:predicted HTH transcriptional regulator
MDVKNNIDFDCHPLELGQQSVDLCIIIVSSLSDDLKYVSFNDQYFERRLTQDRAIPALKITEREEYKRDLAYAKELTAIDKASINDLSLNKINYYVNLLNRKIQSETLKPSLSKAKPFLAHQHFIKEDQVTLLGMLVCGADPFHYLASKVEVNAYYDTSSDIGKDKKIFRSDVFHLMKETFRYIWGNIKINRTINEGGKSEPEYPEILIRETINNAIAHRDYGIDNFITVRVEPNQFIEIKNPGSFREKIKVLHTDGDIQVRRLIPGIPESKNQKLASILKVFDKIESQGRGMASLVNAALDNKIDLPYYEIKENMVSLIIPTGKLVNESAETWLQGSQRYIELSIKNKLTAEHKAVLAYFYKSELLNKRRFFTILLSESNNHFEVIDELKTANILVQHPASTELTPIYVLDRLLLKTDFRNELTDLLGQDYIDFDEVTKEILNLTHLYSKYNLQALKATELTPEVYRRLHGKQIIAKTYESLGRKVRGICNEFQKEGLFLKDEKSAYLFNFDWTKPRTLFS